MLYYTHIRYADDFVFFGNEKQELRLLVEPVKLFLSLELGLMFHPKKIVQKTLSSGIDFLGWVNFPRYKNLRRKTKERMFRKLADNPKNEVFQSYLGLLSHGNTYKVEKELRNLYLLLKE